MLKFVLCEGSGQWSGHIGPRQFTSFAFTSCLGKLFFVCLFIFVVVA